MKTPPDDIADRLIAASRQFRGTGLDVSMDDVAEAADIPRATLYYYFSGRDDLINFYLAHKLDTVSVAMQKAAAGEGTVVDRLDALIRAVLDAMADQPAICTELPEALRKARNDYSELAHKADVVVRQPIRDLLIEGNANGELDIPDVDVAIDSLHGAVNQVALIRITTTGELDADDVGDKLIPLLLDGLTTR